VLRTERLKNKSICVPVAGQLTHHLILVAFGGGTTGFVRRWRIQKRIHKNISRILMQRQQLEILDGPGSRLLCAGHHKLRDTESAEGGGTGN